MPYADILGKMVGGRYVVGRRLGGGAFGEVFEAEQHATGIPGIRIRTVAIKLFVRDYANQDNAPKVFAEAMLLEELAAKARSRGEPVHLVTIHDFGVLKDYHGIPYVAMELVSGNLEDELSAAPALPLSNAVRHARGICAGLRLAHEASPQRIHRDLKPANVLIEKNGFLKVADFGVAVDRHQAFLDGLGAGTIAYAPPENRSGGVSTPAFDVYSLGIVILEMISKANPWGKYLESLEKNDPRLNQKMDRGQESLADLRDPNNGRPLIESFAELQASGAMQALLRSCLAMSPGRRYRNACELDEALAAIEKGRRPILPQPKRPEEYFSEADQYEGKGQIHEALECFRRGFELAPSDRNRERLKGLTKKVARASFLDGRLDEAEQLLRGIQPQDAECDTELSAIRERQGLLDDAVSLMKQALTRQKTRAGCLRLADLYRRQGRTAAAARVENDAAGLL